ESSGASGLDAFAANPLGRDCRNGNRRSDSHDPCQQTPPRDGISSLPRNPASGEDLLPRAARSCQPARTALASLLLFQLTLHSETFTRPANDVGVGGRQAWPAA